MKILLTLCILVFAFSKAFSQLPESPNIYGLFYKHNCKTVVSYGVEKEGEYGYIFADHVHLRTDSTVHSKSIAWLKAGQRVKVLGWTQDCRYKVGDHYDQWYKIQTDDGNLEGFVFGTFFSKSFLTYDLDKDGQQDLLMIGDDFSHASNSKIKIIQNGRLTIEKSLDSIGIGSQCGGLASMLRIIQDPKLSNQPVIEVAAGDNFCSILWRSTYYHWVDNQLKPIFSVNISQYNTSPFLAVRFPSDTDGIRNQIVVHQYYGWDTDDKIKFTLKQAYAFVDGKFKKIR